VTPPDVVVVRTFDGGARLRLRVKPGARQDRLIGAYGDCLKLEVRAAPERGRANAAVTKLLARVFAVSRTAVVVVAGSGSQDKAVEIRGVTVASTIRSLREAGVEAKAG
jgi:uncharacterized protein (TIGR00251 family)